MCWAAPPLCPGQVLPCCLDEPTSRSALYLYNLTECMCCPAQLYVLTIVTMLVLPCYEQLNLLARPVANYHEVPS